MSEPHANTRLEAFCDAVFAIALTLLIIDVKLESPADIGSSAELWRAIQHVLPGIFAFLLSFTIILITWVNHHATLMLVHKSSPAFVYANGFLLLTVVFTPFPTALLGEFLGTDHAAPAVILYNAVLAVQAIGWIAVTGTALRHHLVTDAASTSAIRSNRQRAYGAVALYGLLAIVAWWLPLAVSIATTASWIFWAVLGIRMKHPAVASPGEDSART